MHETSDNNKQRNNFLSNNQLTKEYNDVKISDESEMTSGSTEVLKAKKYNIIDEKNACGREQKIANLMDHHS